MSDPQAPDWYELKWSPWYALDDATKAREAKAPGMDGLYRIRCKGESGLIYIGQSGSSILGRFRQLRKATEYVAAGKKPGPPHVAGGCVLAHEKQGKTVEVSWTTTSGIAPRDRLGMECELIATYRISMGGNPTCQFAGELDGDTIETDPLIG